MRSIGHQSHSNNNAVNRHSASILINQLTSTSEINAEIRRYLQDRSIHGRLDSLVSLLRLNNSVDNSYLLAWIYKSKGDRLAMTAEINNLRSDSSYASLASVLELVDTVSWAAMKKEGAYKMELELISQDTALRVNNCARNILTNVYGYDFSEYITYPSRVSSPRKSEEQPKSSIRVYPNPFSTELTIELPEINNIYKIQLMDMMGREVISVETKGNQNYLLNTENLSNGLFLIRITDLKKVIYVEKINHFSR